MTFNAHKVLEESGERHEQAKHGDPMVAISASIIAVLAALMTMFANHYSVRALSVKNEAILQQARASDAYAYYESKRIKYHIYTAFVAADLARDSHRLAALSTTAKTEEAAAVPILKQANELEADSNENQERSELLLNSHEALEVATTLLEIAIVFVSISALTQTRFLIYLGGGCAIAGVIYGAFALLHAS
jgi:hypothetical protein